MDILGVEGGARAQRKAATADAALQSVSHAGQRLDVRSEGGVPSPRDPGPVGFGWRAIRWQPIERLGDLLQRDPKRLTGAHHGQPPKRMPREPPLVPGCAAGPNQSARLVEPDGWYR